MLNGAGQGIPSKNPGVSGAIGQAQDAISKIVIKVGMNLTGSDIQITELGLAGQSIATATEAGGGDALEDLAGGVGWARFAVDLRTFIYGYVTKCQ